MAEPDTAEPMAAQPVESIEVETAVNDESKVETNEENTVNVEDEGAADNKSDEDAEAEEDAAGAGQDGRPVSREQYMALKNITDVLTDHKVKVGDEYVHHGHNHVTGLALTIYFSEYYPSQLFKRIPNRRVLPDYHEVIKEPVAISTLKGKIIRKTYTGIPEFVRDFAMIVHNAQLYNRPNSAPVRDVFILQNVFQDELKKMVEEGLAEENDTTFPDLGEIPDATPLVSDDEEENDEEDEDDEDEDGADDDSEDGRKKRKRGGGRPSISGRKGRDDDDKATDHKRRVRPPKVDTPMEARIKAILKGLRKPKDNVGSLKIRHFERLPDKQEYPTYFAEIKDPIALDTIKKKAKRKKYQSLEHFMKDWTSSSTTPSNSTKMVVRSIAMPSTFGQRHRN